MAAASEDNLSTTDTFHREATDEIIMILDPTDAGSGTVEREASLTSFTADTVTITWAQAGTAFQVTCIMIQADDAAVVQQSIAASTAINYGFEPDLVLFGATGGDWSDTALVEPSFSVGVMGNSDPVVNGSQTAHWRDAASTAFCSSYASDSYCVVNTDSTLDAAWSGAFTATGVTMTRDLGSLSLDVMTLALQFSNASSQVVFYDAPSSTGGDSVTGVGFTPTWMLGLLANNLSWDVIDVSGDQAGPFSISSITSASQAAVGAEVENGVLTSDASSTLDSRAISVFFDNGQTAHVATLTAFNSDGAEFNYLAANAVSKWMFIAVEEAEAVEVVEVVPDRGDIFKKSFVSKRGDPYHKPGTIFP